MAKTKRFKHDIAVAIIGMSYEEAKNYCLSENYNLFYKDEPIHMNETYVITIRKVDEDGKILEAKYGF
jgi:hypothetical protein